MGESNWCWIKGVGYNTDLIRRIHISTAYTPEDEGDYCKIVYSNGDVEKIFMDDEDMAEFIYEKLMRKTQ